jgi:hypothetical protein
MFDHEIIASIRKETAPLEWWEETQLSMLCDFVKQHPDIPGTDLVVSELNLCREEPIRWRSLRERIRGAVARGLAGT